MEPRIGDAEREVATARLGDHFAAGRLDHEEYDERLDAIWSARTTGDLDQLFEDLPRAITHVVPARPAARRQSRTWQFPFGMFLVGAVLLAVALQMPWWVWLIAIVVLLKRPWSRGWARRHMRVSHGWHGQMSPRR
jgi:hypothetical protein